MADRCACSTTRARLDRKINELYHAAGETQNQTPADSPSRITDNDDDDANRAPKARARARVRTLFVSTNIQTGEIYTSQSRH